MERMMRWVCTLKKGKNIMGLSDNGGMVANLEEGTLGAVAPFSYIGSNSGIGSN